MRENFAKEFVEMFKKLSTVPSEKVLDEFDKQRAYMSTTDQFEAVMMDKVVNTCDGNIDEFLKLVGPGAVMAYNRFKYVGLQPNITSAIQIALNSDRPGMITLLVAYVKFNLKDNDFVTCDVLDRLIDKIPTEEDLGKLWNLQKVTDEEWEESNRTLHILLDYTPIYKDVV